MRYVELEPPPPVRGPVTCLWVLEQDPEPGAPPETILPDGRAELIFNLGTPYRRLGEDAHALQPRSFVVGQIRRSLEVVPAGPLSMIGVRFQPTALQRLLGGSMSELTDRTVPLADLGRPDLLELEARLQDAPDERRRLALVNEWLLTAVRPRTSDADAALELIRGTHGRLDLARVAERVGLSHRTLDRRFALGVGLSPKLFSRQVRLQRVFELLSRTPRPCWSDIALASGCFDQAHLNREFRAFAGQSPGEFLRSRHDLSDHLTGLAGPER